MEAVEVVQPLDRHVVARDPVERSTAVGRGGIHGQDEARDQTDDREPAEHWPRDLLEGRDVEAAVVAGRADDASEAERQEDVHEQRERGDAPERLLRVAPGVVIFGREARRHLDPIGRPAHDEEPHQGDREVTETAGAVDVLEVGRMPVPGEVRHDDEDRERDHQQRTGDVAHCQRRLDAEDVEQPHGQDHEHGDQLRESEIGEPEVEVDLRGLAREPLGDDQRADDVADERQHHRPADPVPERADGAEKVEAAPPALVRVQRDPARLVGEHRRRLRVDPVLQQSDGGRDPPEQHGPPHADRRQGEAQRAQQERRLTETDDEAVVPMERLEELALLDDCLSQVTPPLCEGTPTSVRARYSTRLWSGSMAPGARVAGAVASTSLPSISGRQEWSFLTRSGGVDSPDARGTDHGSL